MISSIYGELQKVGEGYVDVIQGGIGYRIYVPMGARSPFFTLGEDIILYTHLSVSQDAIALYGLYSEEERDLFLMLIGVSGIGPKGALGVLSALSPDELRLAIVSDDASAICAAPGIGKKTAQKVILELKDKIDAMDVFAQSVDAEITGNTAVNDDAATEAIEALVALGYRPAEARGAVMHVAKEEMDVEAILREALKEL